MDGSAGDARPDAATEQPRLTEKRLRAGVWEALVSTGGSVADPPRIEVLHDGRSLPGVSVSPVQGHPGAFALQVPIPIETIGDGVQAFLVRDASGRTLAQFVIAAGDVLVDDLRAEVALLRAELDMLKRAFRRHCLETGAA